MTQTTRFIHIQEPTDRYNGMTIAYTRSEETIYFSFAFCCKPDTYDKSKGRAASVATYMKHIGGVTFDTEFVDFENRVGVMSLETVLEYTTIRTVLADHLVKKMTLMDFKHAILADVLFRFVEERHSILFGDGF